jgi:hypothetical protein
MKYSLFDPFTGDQSLKEADYDVGPNQIDFNNLSDKDVEILSMYDEVKQ